MNELRRLLLSLKSKRNRAAREAAEAELIRRREELARLKADEIRNTQV